MLAKKAIIAYLWEKFNNKKKEKGKQTQKIKPKKPTLSVATAWLLISWSTSTYIQKNLCHNFSFFLSSSCSPCDHLGRRLRRRRSWWSSTLSSFGIRPRRRVVSGFLEVKKEKKFESLHFILLLFLVEKDIVSKLVFYVV